MNSKFFALSALLSGMVVSASAQLVFSNITAAAGSTGVNLSAVAVGGANTNVLLAVGTNSRVFVATVDASDLDTTSTWYATNVSTSISPTTNLQLKAVAYGNGQFAASGSNNIVFRSTDGGRNWASAGKVFANNAIEIQGLAHNGGTFVATPASSQNSWTTNLLSPWTVGATTNSFSYPYEFLESFRGVTAFGANKFAAVGVQGIIRVSTNGGRLWNGVIYVTNSFSRPDLFSVASDGNNTLVAVGANAYMLVSTNGGFDWATNSSLFTTDGTRSLNAVAYLDPGFIAVGRDGPNNLIVTSPNGLDWVVVASSTVTSNLPPTPPLRGVTYVTRGPLAGVALLVGDGGTVLLGGSIPPQPVSLGDKTDCVGLFTNQLCVSVTNDNFLTVDWYTTEARSAGDVPAPGGTGVTCFRPVVNAANTSVGEHKFYAETRDKRTGIVSTSRTRVSLFVDPIPPTAVCSNITIALDNNGYASIQPSNVDGGSFDNCAITNLTVTPNEFSCINVATNNPVTLRVTDSAGWTTECTAIVTVVDNILPVPNCPANITVANDPGLCGATVPFAASPTDNCGIASIVYQTNGVMVTSPTFFPVGTTTVNVTVTDVNGNSAPCSFTVTVNDTEKPAPNCPANITVTNTTGQCLATVPFMASPTDNCGVLSTVYRTNGVVVTSPTVFPVGVTTVDVTVTDIHTNVATCSFTVTVNDTEEPAITCPADITVINALGQCASNVTFLVTATDNCAVATTVSTPPSGFAFPVGVTTVTNVATDIYGNTNVCFFTVTVNDTEQPEITCPPDIAVINAIGQCGSNVTFTVTATDNCAVATIVSTPPSGFAFPVGVTTVTNVATDIYGNTNVCFFTVTVNDTEQPAITCPADIAVTNALGQCASNVTFLVTATDNCAVATIVSTPPSGFAFPVGVTTVTNVATDIYGNTNVCFFTVTVNDTEVPAITCPADITVINALGQCTSNVTFTVTATDNCAVATIVSTPPSGFAFPVGVTTVTNVATDIYGNTNVCFFTVTVNDTEVPAITCPADIAVTNALGQCASNVTFLVTATDNCAVATTVSTPPSGFAFPVGVTTVTNVATDIYGNTNVCFFTVTVNDTEVPAITCPADIAVTNALGQCTSNVTFLVTATDNCAVATTVSTPPSGFAFPVGVTTVTNVATDIYGNTNVCFFTVTVNDTEVPAITCPPDIAVINALGQCGSNVTFTVTATDNCAVATTVSTPPSGFAFPVGITTVTNVATDIYGNTNVCFFTVTVTDTEPPAITCPADIVIPQDAVQCGAVVSYTVSASDNCGVLTTNQLTGLASGEVFPIGTTTNTFVFADAAGNTNTCTFKVIVQPRLSIRLETDKLVLTWCDTNSTLQSASVLTNPPSSIVWTNVPGATSPWTNSITAAEAYFRLFHAP